MGVFEKVMQERHPGPDTVAMTTREALAAIVIGAFSADGRAAEEEAIHVNAIFGSSRLFREPSEEPAQAAVDRVLGLFGAHGGDRVVALAAQALPGALRAPAFATAVDIVLADGTATVDERRFIDRLQEQLGIGDEDALKIVEVLIVKNSL